MADVFGGGKLTAWPQIGPERFRAPEILFDPEIIGLEYSGVHQMVVDAITRTDLDLRKALYSNIVLSGGTTLTKGFGDRLLHEVQKLAVRDMRIKIFAPPERKYSTWIGGSILAGLSTFRKVSPPRARGAGPPPLCISHAWGRAVQHMSRSDIVRLTRENCCRCG